jgi:hypothetical protein
VVKRKGGFDFSHSRVAILVHVPKLHFSSKYSDAPALRSANTTFGLRPEGCPLSHARGFKYYY